MWNLFTPNEIKPSGWIKKQLQIQADGLSGNLDKVWRDVRDSSWIGGDAEGWERVPYWLDGFIPLAYLLENEDMINRAKKYIDAIIDSQKADGWICPCEEEKISEYDTWAIQLISKTLLTYYSCSNDKRIPAVLYKMLKNYYTLLKDEKIKLFNWGKYRWFECFFAINFLYDLHKEDWLIDLGKILREQGTDYEKASLKWKTPIHRVTFDTHLVNISMMMKCEAITHKILNEPYTNKAEHFYKILKNFNGTPVEVFTGDEHLNGLSPIQGTELCAVVEQMFSYETLFSVTGDKKWLERLEVIAFNALPATISDDMWTHQYDQLSNQISCEKFPTKPIFGTNPQDSHLFGLEPSYGCCTANFSQGWPKFLLSSFMYKDDTILNTLPIPAILNTDKGKIVLETDYPFKNKFIYKIEAKENFELKVRIPSFANNLKINGEFSDNKTYLTFSFKKGEKKEIKITFDAEIEIMDRPHNLKSIKCGSLVFSLPIRYEKKMYEYILNNVERKFPYCDYEYIGKSDWNYGYSDVEFKLIEKDISDIPFSSEKPAVIVEAKMKKIPWGLEKGYEKVCAKIPESLIPISEEEKKELYPYGSAKLRMTEIPFID